MRKETIKLISTREKLLNVYCRTNRLIALDIYKLVRNKVNSALHSGKVSETKGKLLTFKESNKAFYGYVRSKQKVRLKGSPTKKEG